ncbi:DEAD/DEAH box helicase [Georgenia wutianyii]|uniref:DEAD/DEAH box helicase n=1 Tax=Georgenia wutianyii TaxID=2585135 RepID=A0ABX5VRV7_9MICO|nr:DEAD/DEAH box helicase [Georgenia wutianyii]QDB80396.1 DEAD/DEAH box helicase [Georgenia wutianyii]
MTSFASFDLPAPVVQHLSDTGITAPFPIQTATLPDTLSGRDVLGRGRTGSGKTLAFALPLVTRLAGRRRVSKRPSGLVLVPTRELANQVNAVVEPLATSLGLVTTTIFGGVNQTRQVNALRSGVDIVIACPGRLEDLLGQGVLSLEDVQITVLDEADHMADLGFLPGVKRIMDRTPRVGQRMLFSATLDNGVDVLVKRYLTNPLHHAVDSAESPVAAMTHHVLAVSGADDKKDIVQELASGTGRRVLFTRTKHQAKRLAKQLTTAGVPAVDLHGNLTQPARERNLAAFSSGAVRVLVATDIAARGIHVDDVELVVHVDPPAEHKAYLHRSGRTARAGSGGDVVTIMLPEQTGDMRTLTRQAKISAKPVSVRPGDKLISELVGERAQVVSAAQAAATVPSAPQQPQRAAGGGQRRGGRGRSTGSGQGPATSASAPQRTAGRGRAGQSSGRPQGGAGSRSVYSSSTGQAPVDSRGQAGGARAQGGRRPSRRATSTVRSV